MGHSFSRFFSRYFAKKEVVRILMMGLKDAGKTTILNNLKLGEIVTSAIPTTPDIIIDLEAGGDPQPEAGFNVEMIKSGDISITVWDVEAKCQINPLLPQYFQNLRGLIFVVDSNNRDRLVEARYELHDMLNKDKFRDIALLVYANKHDLPNAMNATDLTKELDLHSLRQHHWYIQSTCSTTGEGLYDGLDWLFNEIDNMA